MKFWYWHALDCPSLLHAAWQLTTKGALRVFKDGLVYLDLDDDYIHQLFPLLPDKHSQKPEYFTAALPIGAHISIVYPGENKIIDAEELKYQHAFHVTGLFQADYGCYKYYMLGVKSDSLLQLRRRYGLTDQLDYEDHRMDLHITIGIRNLNSKL